MDQLAMVDRVSEWAAADDNIRAVVLTGSVARGDHDDLSDVDVELYARDPSQLLSRRDWYEEFGDVLAVEELLNPGWLPTRLLYLADGKIDFAIGELAALGPHLYRRPFRVLVDKDDRGSALQPAGHRRLQEPPSPEELDQCMNWFFAAALMQANLIARREPWLAKYRDWDLKAQLLRVIEWDHQLRHGFGYDTWYHGKHINDWADADVRSELDACWAGFAVEEAVSSVRASMDLFRRLTDRIAEALSIPPFRHDRVREEVDRILARSEEA